MLSFPRDLWVHIAGSDSDNRINSAYIKNDPTTLIRTIYDNFGIGIDHFVQVDFCAFKTLVDAVGGVTVPFEYPTRDLHTGSTFPWPGCFTLSGDHALAYVRSRHYEYLDPKTGKWTEDAIRRSWPHLATAGLPAPARRKGAQHRRVHAVGRAWPDPAPPSSTW